MLHDLFADGPRKRPFYMQHLVQMHCGCWSQVLWGAGPAAWDVVEIPSGCLQQVWVCIAIHDSNMA